MISSLAILRPPCRLLSSSNNHDKQDGVKQPGHKAHSQSSNYDASPSDNEITEANSCERDEENVD